MKVKEAVNTAKLFLSNNSPLILTGMSIIGTISTAIMASQATLKAEEILYDNGAEDLPWQDKTRLVWKCYIPTGLMGVSTIGCIVGSHICGERQKAALQSAYLLSQTTLQEYQKKVVERIGKNKERELYDETLKEVANRQGQPTTVYSDGGMAGEVIDTGHGSTLFYDVPGQIYFKSDINYIRSKVNDLNAEVRTEMYFDWNEIYYRWGLPMRKYGSEMIFDVDHPLELKLDPEMMENGQVRILLDYELRPKCTYER